MKNKKCLTCNSVFEPKYKSQKYCRKECHNESMKKVFVTTCEQCGRIVESNDKFRSERVKFCSNDCFYHSMRKKAPTEEILYNDYVIKRLTTREIAKKYDVTKTSVSRWMKKYKIQPRTASESRMYDGYEPPSKEELYKLYWDDWFSYESIADMYNVDQASIPNWLNRYGIKRRDGSETRLGKNYKEPTKEQLEDWYIVQHLDSQTIGKILGIDHTTVLDKLHKHGIKVRPNIINGKGFRKCEDGHLVRSNYEKAFDDALYRNNIDHEYEPRLPFSKRHAADFLVGDVYIEVWGLMKFEKYREGRKKKLELYRENKCKLFEVYPDDFQNLDNKINELKLLIS